MTIVESLSAIVTNVNIQQGGYIMNISKDQSIIMQVAAKIASELTPTSDDANTNITTFADVYDAVCDIILTSQGMTTSSTPMAPAVSTPQQSAQEEAMIVKAFPEATPVQVPSSGFAVRIKGKQHGPIPEWLNEACAVKGVTEVWDNRDGLQSNPKRPWFKSTSTNDAFWAPKN
jgi:hypothetical protein